MKFKYKTPRLCQNAVPSILPGCPRYLSSEHLPRPTRFICDAKDEEHFAHAIRLSLDQQAYDTEKVTVHHFQKLITDTRQIELFFQEIESYSTPNSLPTKLDTFEHHFKEASNHLSISISKLN